MNASTGIGGLDHVLGGGLPAGHLYLIEGDPGAGKTTMALQFLLEGRRSGERCLYVTLSESCDELVATAKSHGWTLDGIELFELNAAQQSELGDEVSLFHPGEIELGEAMKTLLDEVDRRAPHRVIFDSLSEIRLLAQQPLRYRRQILSLKQHFSGRPCTVLLLDDRTSEPNDKQLMSIAHGVLTLEQLTPSYGAERRRLHVRKLRGARFRGGFHDFVIATGGLQVFPRLVAAEHRDVTDATRVSSGNADLDALLGGGLMRGTSTLVVGPAGAGKSSIVATFALAAAARGERGAVFLFDENVGAYLTRTDSLNMPVREHMKAGRIALHPIDPAELSPGEFAHRVQRAVEAGAQFIAIDSLNGYLHAMPEEQFLVVQLHELLTYLTQRGVLTFLVSTQRGFLGSAMQSEVDISYIADTVLLLRYFEAQGAIRNAFSVLKQRTGLHEKTIREFFLSGDGLRVGPALSNFQGVLTGVPRFLGSASQLLGADADDADDNA